MGKPRQAPASHHASLGSGCNDGSAHVHPFQGSCSNLLLVVYYTEFRLLMDDRHVPFPAHTAPAAWRDQVQASCSTY